MADRYLVQRFLLNRAERISARTDDDRDRYSKLAAESRNLWQREYALDLAAAEPARQWTWDELLELAERAWDEAIKAEVNNG